MKHRFLALIAIAWAGMIAVAALALLWGSALLLATQAGAQERYCNAWGQRQVCSQEWPFSNCWWQRYCRRHAYTEGYRYYSAPREDYERRSDRQHCHDVRKVVGDQHLTVDGAKKAANDAWAGAVRFHLGESAMDLAYARHITYVCSRSSIKEGGVTTLGQTLTRCELSAQPCRAPQQRGGSMTVDDSVALLRLHAAAWSTAAQTVKTQHPHGGANDTASAHMMRCLAEMADAVAKAYDAHADALTIIKGPQS